MSLVILRNKQVNVHYIHRLRPVIQVMILIISINKFRRYIIVKSIRQEHMYSSEDDHQGKNSIYFLLLYRKKRNQSLCVCVCVMI